MPAIAPKMPPVTTPATPMVVSPTPVQKVAGVPRSSASTPRGGGETTTYENVLHKGPRGVVDVGLVLVQHTNVVSVEDAAATQVDDAGGDQRVFADAADDDGDEISGLGLGESIGLQAAVAVAGLQLHELLRTHHHLHVAGGDDLEAWVFAEFDAEGFVEGRAQLLRHVATADDGEHRDARGARA